MNRPKSGGFCSVLTFDAKRKKKKPLNKMENLQDQDSNCSFVWDENSQLYFHASSGFYHDPIAGWYYSSCDGSYYKFENGSYVLLELEETGKCTTYQYEETVPDNSVKGEACEQVCCTNNENHSSFDTSDFGPYKCKEGEIEGIDVQALENPPPTSLWLEDTLIDLFLSGCSNPEVIATDDDTSPTINDANNLQSPSDGYDDTQRTEGECLQDEENWKAQYGQVTQYGEETIPKFSAIDIWDWSTVSESRTGGKGKVTMLIGRVVRKSAKLHPSLSSNSAFLKTAPICRAHLDLVQVATGKIYKLHCPSKRYLASKATFNSSNPTKDWGFPVLLDGKTPSFTMHDKEKAADMATISIKASTSLEKHSSQNQYRDRAAERRTLHGGFGLGPGQKKSAIDNSDLPSPVSDCSESIAAEAFNISFGAGSYGRKILESMGWKEGKGLGRSTEGMVEPVKAVENIGNAGLGWPRGIKEVFTK